MDTIQVSTRCLRRAAWTRVGSSMLSVVFGLPATVCLAADSDDVRSFQNSSMASLLATSFQRQAAESGEGFWSEVSQHQSSGRHGDAAPRARGHHTGVRIGHLTRTDKVPHLQYGIEAATDRGHLHGRGQLMEQGARPGSGLSSSGFYMGAGLGWADGEQGRQRQAVSAGVGLARLSPQTAGGHVGQGYFNAAQVSMHYSRFQRKRLTGDRVLLLVPTIGIASVTRCSEGPGTRADACDRLLESHLGARLSVEEPARSARVRPFLQAAFHQGRASGTPKTAEPARGVSYGLGAEVAPADAVVVHAALNFAHLRDRKERGVSIEIRRNW